MFALMDNEKAHKSNKHKSERIVNRDIVRTQDAQMIPSISESGHQQEIAKNEASPRANLETLSMLQGNASDQDILMIARNS